MPYQHLELQQLPQDVRALVVLVARTLAERGARGLVAAGFCPPEAEQVLADNRSYYPGTLIELPDSAELWAFTTPDGVWEIELPLHDDREGPMDLFLFVEVNPKDHSVLVTGLHTP
jgi:hypothetical protein